MVPFFYFLRDVIFGHRVNFRISPGHRRSFFLKKKMKLTSAPYSTDALTRVDG